MSMNSDVKWYYNLGDSVTYTVFKNKIKKCKLQKSLVRRGNAGGEEGPEDSHGCGEGDGDQGKALHALCIENGTHHQREDSYQGVSNQLYSGRDNLLTSSKTSERRTTKRFSEKRIFRERASN